MNPDTGHLRELTEELPLIDGEIKFEVDQQVEINGCFFVVKKFLPRDRMVLKGIPKPKEDKWL